MSSAPNTGAETALIDCANAARRRRQVGSPCQAPRAETISAERIRSPGRNSGDRAPDMPKLTRQSAPGIAAATRASVRRRSPAPTTVENPRRRAIRASTASPETQTNADLRSRKRLGSLRSRLAREYGRDTDHKIDLQLVTSGRSTPIGLGCVQNGARARSPCDGAGGGGNTRPGGALRERHRAVLEQ